MSAAMTVPRNDHATILAVAHLRAVRRRFVVPYTEEFATRLRVGSFALGAYTLLAGVSLTALGDFSRPASLSHHVAGLAIYLVTIATALYVLAHQNRSVTRSLLRSFHPRYGLMGGAWVGFLIILPTHVVGMLIDLCSGWGTLLADLPGSLGMMLVSTGLLIATMARGPGDGETKGGLMPTTRVAV